MRTYIFRDYPSNEPIETNISLSYSASGGFIPPPSKNTITYYTDSPLPGTGLYVSCRYVPSSRGYFSAPQLYYYSYKYKMHTIYNFSLMKECIDNHCKVSKWEI